MLIAVAAAAAAAACAGDGDAGTAAQDRPRDTQSTPAPQPTVWPSVVSYEPSAAETYRNGKRLASRAVLRAVTYPRGASAAEVAARIGQTAISRRELASVIAPVVERDRESSGQIVYPQLSGVTETSMGAMVVVRQRLTAPGGDARRVTRVFDVRLRRSGGPWSVDRIASVGGSAVRRPADLDGPARAVVDDPRIELSDTARWDVFRGDVDPGLLSALEQLADRHRISVSVLRSGHPRAVWATDRLSAHSRGFAADIYKVDGRLVVTQRQGASDAREAAAYLVQAGAEQVGSPWILGPGGSRSFTDVVHEDHLHLQWSPL